MKKQAIFQAIFQFILTALALSGILLVAFFPQRIALTGCMRWISIRTITITIPSPAG
jgi:hypothetical protein